ELGVERERDVTDEAAEELVSDRSRRPLGDRAQQVAPAEPRIGFVDVERGRHQPAPAADASDRRGPRKKRGGRADTSIWARLPAYRVRGEVRLTSTSSADRDPEAPSDLIADAARARDELERFFALSLDMLCVADSGGIFTRVNPAFERAL